MALWRPRMFPKQYDVFNSKKRAVLVAGPRKSGKTIAVSHKFCRHLWETPGASAALVARTIKSAKDSGTWMDLLTAVEEWRAAEIGFDFTSVGGNHELGPRTDQATKTVQFSVTNMFGGESRAYLFSIDNDNEVEIKLKSTRWSMLWFSELSNFASREIYRASILQLRATHLRMDQMQWIADTNPSEEGEESWIYDYWYRLQNIKNHPHPEWQKQFELIEIFMEDNPFLKPLEIQEVEAQYADDPGALDRYRWGKWTRGHGFKSSHFGDLFSTDIHVIGNAEEDLAELDPSTDTLYGGWDLGEVNSCWFALEKRIVGDKAIWVVLREVAMIGVEISTSDFTELVLMEMDGIEKQFGKKFKWKHWSDDSAIHSYRASADTYDYLTVRDASGGRIELEGVNKPQGSVRRCVQFFRQLIKERRLFICHGCPYATTMLRELRKGETMKNFVEPLRLKHGFDAMRYPIFMESLQDFEISSSSITTADSFRLTAAEF